MNIRGTLDRIIAVQGGLTISSPISATIKKAYKYFPAQNVALPDTPAFINTWTLVSEERKSGLRYQHYTVNMQLLVLDANMDRAADIVTAFHVALVDAFDADTTLEGNVTVQMLRGGDPTLVLLTRADLSYIGLNEFLDIYMTEAATFAP